MPGSGAGYAYGTRCIFCGTAARSAPLVCSSQEHCQWCRKPRSRETDPCNGVLNHLWVRGHRFEPRQLTKEEVDGGELEKQIETIVDKQEMHGLIDAVQDGKTAILIAENTTGGATEITFFHIGTLPLWKLLGMIEAVKVEVSMHHYHEAVGAFSEDDGPD